MVGVRSLYLCLASRDGLSSDMQQVNATARDEIMAEQRTCSDQAAGLRIDIGCLAAFRAQVGLGRREVSRRP